MLLILLFLAPVHDSRSDAIWQAAGSDLRKNSVLRNIDTSITSINHYAFLTGRDSGGAIGIAYLSTPCFRAAYGKINSFLPAM